MLYRMNDSSLTILRNTGMEAIRHGHSVLLPSHILLAMSRGDKESHAYLVLSNAHLTYSRLSRSFMIITPQPSIECVDESATSKDFAEVLNLANKIAVRNEHTRIGSAHLLIAILAYMSPDTETIVDDMNISRATVIEQAEKYIPSLANRANDIYLKPLLYDSHLIRRQELHAEMTSRDLRLGKLRTITRFIADKLSDVEVAEGLKIVRDE